MAGTGTDRAGFGNAFVAGSVSGVIYTVNRPAVDAGCLAIGSAGDVCRPGIASSGCAQAARGVAGITVNAEVPAFAAADAAGRNAGVRGGRAVGAGFGFTFTAYLSAGGAV